MKAARALALFTLAGGAAAFWRMPCRSRTGLSRIDPIVDPDDISSHVHAIHGGGNFGLVTDYELLKNSPCTSCGVHEDKSAYWTPALYFMYQNGTTVLVDQVGGMLAYYLFYLDNITVFPQGFQMLAGNKNLRNFTGPFPDEPLSNWPTYPSDQFFLQQRALGFNCLDYSKDPEPSLYRHTMPDKAYLDANCVDGIRMELAFPSCWNGSLDSSDHTSHVAWPSLVKEGNCPDTHPLHLPFLFYETIWNTNAFAGHPGTFMLSQGDPTGSGYHGDFIMGWDSSDFLNDAMNTCTSQSGQIEDCPLFSLQSDASAALCEFEVPSILLGNEPEGPRQGLPVDIPVQWGPEPATAYPIFGAKGFLPTISLDLPFLKSTDAPDSDATDSPASAAGAQDGYLWSATAMAHNAAPTPVTTPAASLQDAADGSADVATSYITNGNEVVALEIHQVVVTVTATTTMTETAGWSKHKRHMDKHLRRNRLWD